MRDEHNVKRDVGQVQFNRLAPVDVSGLHQVKTAALIKNAALKLGPAIRTLHGVSSKFENRNEIEER
jgi:hypothetical protein